MTPEEVMREVRRLELTTRNLVRDLVAGEYTSAFRGRGVEFSEVREYQPGDDVRSIDWNVTARLGSAHVKRFQEERELSVFLAVDLSASGHFGSRRRTKRELGIEVCAVLALAAARNNDRIGGLFFTDRIEHFVPSAKGRRHALRLVNDLLAFEPAGQGTDLNRALEYLEPLLHRRSVLFVVSDFLTETGNPALTRLAARHDVIAVQVSDPRERELPPGLLTLRDPETGRQVTVDARDTRLRRHFQAQLQAAESRWERELEHRGVDRLRLETDVGYGDRLVTFFRRRERRRAS
jgi:uncharacterized protein (DUF58 family)